MIDFNEKINSFGEKTRAFILNPLSDSGLINIFKNNNINNQDVVDSISNAISLYLLGEKTIQNLFDLILFRLDNRKSFAMEFFGQINNDILIPMGFNTENKQPNFDLDEDDVDRNDVSQDNSLDDNDIYEDMESLLTPEDLVEIEEIGTDKQKTTKLAEPQKEETAEDILKEIENPTPLVSSSLEILKKNMSANTTHQAQLPTEPSIQSTAASPSTPEITPSIPTISVMPSKEPLKKEDQIKAKLNQPITQTEKSTYYKVDPYREQP